jgi:hypothetical protein
MWFFIRIYIETVNRVALPSRVKQRFADWYTCGMCSWSRHSLVDGTIEMIDVAEGLMDEEVALRTAHGLFCRSSPGAVAARAGMNGNRVRCDERRRQRRALDSAKPRVSARRGRTPRHFDSQRIGGDRISLRRALPKRKIAAD